jgi:putative transposase
LGSPDRPLVLHDIRDTIVDFVRTWFGKTELAVERFIAWLEVPRGKFFDWQKRYGKANEHNGLVPRDHWLLDEEQRQIIAFHDRSRSRATAGWRS